MPGRFMVHMRIGNALDEYHLSDIIYNILYEKRNSREEVYYIGPIIDPGYVKTLA